MPMTQNLPTNEQIYLSFVAQNQLKYKLHKSRIGSLSWWTGKSQLRINKNFVDVFGTISVLYQRHQNQLFSQHLF